MITGCIAACQPVASSRFCFLTTTTPWSSSVEDPSWCNAYYNKSLPASKKAILF